MISMDMSFLTKENVSEFLQDFYYGEYFSFGCGIPGLCRVQLLTIESNWFAILGDTCSQMHKTCICVDVKWQFEVRVSQECFSGHDLFHLIKCSLMLNSPIPLHLS